MSTYQSSRAIDAGVASPDAVKPFGLAELPETVFFHFRKCDPGVFGAPPRR